jgi:dephospho-CoA kinase
MGGCGARFGLDRMGLNASVQSESARLDLALAPPYLIGLTGGIGSGKSTVAGFMASLGARIIDTDAISRQLTQAGGAAIESIRDHFGAHLIDANGALDRVQMRTLVFHEPRAKARLESILHPLIFVHSQTQVRQALERVVVLDIPLLVETTRWLTQVHQVWVVDCDEEMQVQRVIKRSGWKEDAVRRVIAQQASREERRRHADVVILNDSGLSTLSDQVNQAWSQLPLIKK